LLLFIIVSLTACNQKSVEESIESVDGESLEITGEVVTEILRACKYANEDFCSEECCISQTMCDNEVAYVKCNLNTGEWNDISYKDSKCLTECKQNETEVFSSAINNLSINEIKKDENQYNKSDLNLSLCASGWKCVETKYRGYQLSDCSWNSSERCDYKCEDGLCKSPTFCVPNSLKCFDKELKKCDENGSKWMTKESCTDDCSDGACIYASGSAGSNQNPNETQQMDYIKDRCINVTNFNSDANGTDNSSNLNDEYLTLKNRCSYLITMTNWTATDAANHVFTFPSFDLSNNAEVSVRTGSGINTLSDIYWGRGSHVWNNGGDTLYLNSLNGTLILSCSYIKPNNLTNLTCGYS